MMKAWSRFLLPAMLALLLPGLGLAQMSVDVSVNVPPPELPVYDQPPIPGDGYIWTPGYWAWSDDDQDYYWVPGTWVPAPQPDYLWTPGYWAASGAVFLWHAGYWGPHVGFYGGVPYGYGYGGNGYEGGYWQGGRMYYNRSVNNVSNVNITNVYNKTVVNNVTVNRVSYNGGNGIHAQPTPEQIAAGRERHIEATPLQRQHVDLARRDTTLHSNQNQGRPPIAATPKPAAFSGAGVVPARGGTLSVVHPNQPQQNQPQQNQPQRDNPGQRQNPAERAPAPRPPAPSRPQSEPREGMPPVERRGAEPPPPPPPPAPHAAAPPPPPPPAPHAAPPPPAHPAPPHPERPAERDHEPR
jgi:hypothetical protein